MMLVLSLTPPSHEDQVPPSHEDQALPSHKDQPPPSHKKKKEFGNYYISAALVLLIQ